MLRSALQHRLTLMTWCLIYHVTIQGAWGLRDMRMRVPATVLAGAAARLACDYDLERAPLYSIKWYRDDQEFYRYVPKEEPPGRAFEVEPPIDVDVVASTAYEVRLRGVARTLSGVYKCEVTADAPLFHTDIRSAHMTVAEVRAAPNGGPKLSTDPSEAAVAGNPVRASCHSPPASPPANITWYINGQQISDEHLIHSDPILKEKDYSGLLTVTSNVLVRSTFRDGIMHIRCEAAVLDVYRGSAENRLKVLAPPPATILGPTAPLGLSESYSAYNKASSYLLYGIPSWVLYVLTAMLCVNELW